MIVTITKEHLDFVDSYAKEFDLGGYSNLSKEDLNKASRLDFQYTGLFGELAWHIYRYSTIEYFRKLLDKKIKILKPTRQGDNGFDDVLTVKNKSRNIDIKTTHVQQKEKIKTLNLIVPKREYHQDMIYIAAFSIGNSRRLPTHVDLSGWCINEDVTQPWRIDESKLCVQTKDLRNLSLLDEYLTEDPNGIKQFI